MWRIFEEIRELGHSARNGATASQIGTFEKSHEDVQQAMQLTVATGSDLIAKLRIRNTDRQAEQHILSLVQDIRQNSSSVNTKLVSEQQRLEGWDSSTNLKVRKYSFLWSFLNPVKKPFE